MFEGEGEKATTRHHHQTAGAEEKVRGARKEATPDAAGEVDCARTEAGREEARRTNPCGAAQAEGGLGGHQ